MRKIIVLLLSVVVLFSCSDRNSSLKINGVIQNAQDEVLYLNVLSNTGVEVIDSAVLNRKGKFSFAPQKTAYPEFYFLKFKTGNAITLLADSTEEIVVNGTYPNLIDNVEINGSKESLLILENDRKLNVLRHEFSEYKKNWDAALDSDDKKVLADDFLAKLADYKKEAGSIILQNPRSFYGYNVLYQRLEGDYVIFSPYNEEDFMYYGALATSLNMFYPDAPRTKAFYAKVEDAIAFRRKNKIVKMINEASGELPDIGMPDLDGDTIMLSSTKGKVVILNYWLSSDENSRLLNKILKSLYGKYKYKGLEIFQCSLDKSKLMWEIALEQDKINWISLCDFKGRDSRNVWVYNVTEVPTNYLLDRNGNLVGKFTDPIELEKKIKALL